VTNFSDTIRGEVSRRRRLQTPPLSKEHRLARERAEQEEREARERERAEHPEVADDAAASRWREVTGEGAA
jgi:hypothetical protein